MAFSEEATRDDLDDLFVLSSNLADRIRRETGLARLGSSQRAQVRALWSSNSTAAKFMAEGLAKARLSEPARARDLFRRAIANDPGHAPAHMALSEALLALGEHALAEKSAQRAYELRDDLPEPIGLVIEAAYFRASGHSLADKGLHEEAQQAFEQARRLFEEAGEHERAHRVARELTPGADG